MNDTTIEITLRTGVPYHYVWVGIAVHGPKSIAWIGSNVPQTATFDVWLDPVLESAAQLRPSGQVGLYPWRNGGTYVAHNLPRDAALEAAYAHLRMVAT